jgi:subtilisin family serine protease
LQHSDDFSPIVEHGELEVATGILGRITGKRDLPSVGLGTELVLAGRDGKPIANGASITEGEKYWSKAVTWIKVDISEHTLELDIPFRDPTGRAGFRATVTVGASVVNALLVAKLGVVGIKDFLEPVLSEAVASGAGSLKPPTPGDPVATLNTSRTAAEAALREAMRGNVSGLPGWLAANVKAISVAFDQATNRHYEDLVERARRDEHIDAAASNEKREAGVAIALRAQWREALAPSLSNPAMLQVEAVLGEPSQRNIAKAVELINGEETLARDRTFQIFSKLIETGLVYETSELSDAMQQIKAALVVSEGQSAQQAIGPGEAPRIVDAEADAVEHPEVVDEDHS